MQIQNYCLQLKLVTLSCSDLTGRLVFSNELPRANVFLLQMLRLLGGFCLVQENSRLESELLETGEKLAEYESLASKLQRNLENVLAEKVNPLLPIMLPVLNRFSVITLKLPI